MTEEQIVLLRSKGFLPLAIAIVKEQPICRSYEKSLNEVKRSYEEYKSQKK